MLEQIHGDILSLIFIAALGTSVAQYTGNVLKAFNNSPLAELAARGRY